MNNYYMLKIGLTGGIGSGKSTVAKIFNVLGIPVFDADTEAKKIMNESEELKTSIKKEFGEGAYKNDSLDKAYLANIVFSDSYKLEMLNSLVHPYTIKAADDWAVKQNSKYIIKEAALLFEAGTSTNLDFIIGVTAPKHIKINRIINRDGISLEQIKDRMNNQIDDSIKMKLCNFIITNDELNLLTPQIIKLHNFFCK